MSNVNIRSRSSGDTTFAESFEYWMPGRGRDKVRYGTYNLYGCPYKRTYKDMFLIRYLDQGKQEIHLPAFWWIV